MSSNRPTFWNFSLVAIESSRTSYIPKQWWFFIVTFWYKSFPFHAEKKSFFFFGFLTIQNILHIHKWKLHNIVKIKIFFSFIFFLLSKSLNPINISDIVIPLTIWLTVNDKNLFGSTMNDETFFFGRISIVGTIKKHP